MSNLKKSASIAIGATFAASMAAIPVANADENPFGMQNLESGYLQVAEGKCGEGKCGEGNMKKVEEAEGKCGEGKAMNEGKCGESKEEVKETKQMEGKCGEGKCGGKG